MKNHLLKIIFFVIFLLTMVMVVLYQIGGKPSTVAPPAKSTRAHETSTHKRNKIVRNITLQKKSNPDNCKDCSKLINNVLRGFSLNWTKNEENRQKLRSLLIENCNGFQKAIVTQTNSPLGTTISYDGQKKNRSVTPDLFNNFPKDMPFSDKTLDTCAVVGNGGILTNSSCGAAIDSAQFVIRCNLPPLEDGYSEHVGNKTSLVTANPTIINSKYGKLRGRRRAFVDKVSIYGHSLLVLPAFSFSFCTGMSMAVLYTLEDFGSPVKSVFFNPEYLRRLKAFWRSQGLKAFRMTTGFMMVNLALEICNNVELYGFWPFDNHPFDFRPLTNHYYDDRKPNRAFHAMPVEFGHLVKLHNQGVLKLNIGECPL